MATTEQPRFFFFFFFFFFFIIFLSFFTLSLKTKPAIASSSSINTDHINRCSSNMYCSKNEPLIQFPFTLQNQPYCGYPGFTLSCNSTTSTPKKTLLNLGSSGDYLVTNIDYVSQEIQINDPENCLPKRLLQNFSLSNTPFEGFYYRNYTFLNCSSAAVNTSRSKTIRCLSDGNYAVLATHSASLVRFMMVGCEVMGHVKLPISLSLYNQIDVSSELSEDLRLSWGEPDCGDCVARGGRCGFVGNSGTGGRTEIGCFEDGGKRASLPRGIRYVIAIGVGVPALICVVGLTCYICAKVNAYTVRRPNNHQAEASSTVAPQPTVIPLGLDEPTIESYPKTVLGESRRLPKPNDNTCPICLSEYRPKETLRTIPDCAHCFHADCIDEWLRINASCPLCRNSPTAESPLAGAL